MKPDRWKQIEEIYYQAKKRDARARTAFLNEACGADEQLRSDVESLLRANDEADTLLIPPAMAQMIAEEQRPRLVGKRISRYEIVEQIGAGGMGEVYRAKDIRLNREVAVKVLPGRLSQNTEALARFEREARAVAALSHPNILAIHDFGAEQGICYAVTELLEGETLRSRLSRSALAWREAARIGVAVADGLSGAHAKGIIHRDLKPENIFLLRDDRVKILDFGLARITGPGSDSADSSAIAMTEPGTVMGTVGYMSPEQVRGEAVDGPSDLFSLGCVLYEMLAGRRAFMGQGTAETMAAILRDEPPALADSGQDAPDELKMIITHCLEKGVGDRFHSARDLSFALRALLSGSRAALSLAQPNPRIRPAMWRWITPFFVIAALFLVILYFRQTPKESGSIQFTIPLPGSWIQNATNQSLAVSPDGQHLAFVLQSPGTRMLWVRPRDSVSGKTLAGTEGAASPFWSPDSRWIGFFAEGKLKKIEASGGPPQIICGVPIEMGTGTWSRQGTILFAGEGGSSEGIYRVSDTGGEAAPVIKPDHSKNQFFYFWPHFLPDGRHFLYLGSDEQRKGDMVYIGSLDTGEGRPLVENSSRVEYAPPGYLVYVRQGTLVAHPFDAGALKFTGEPIPIAEQVQHFDPTGYGEFSASETLLAYRAGVIASRLVWFDRNGRELGVVGAPGQYEEPRLSPDEKKVAVGLVDPRTGTLDIWTLDLTRDLVSRITATSRYTDYGPVWSPDGRDLAFVSDIAGPPHLCRKPSSGAGDAEALLPPGEIQWADDWSADGRFIVYAEVGPKTGIDVWMMPLFGERKPFPFVNTPFNEQEARFSADGRWVAYVSNESGENEVYVQPFQKSGERWRISTTGGSQPVWRRDGKELFYLASDNKLMAVPVRTGTSFEAGIPKVLFRIDPAPEHAYDVTADGQRILVNTSVTRAESLPITAVVNWAAALKPHPTR